MRGFMHRKILCGIRGIMIYPPRLFATSSSRQDEDEAQQCLHVLCNFLPLGWLLLVVDSYFDLRWVMFPSQRTAESLKNYYTTILTPRWYNPGLFFPPYAIYKMCLECPNPYNFALLVLFMPLAYRYRLILQHRDSLNHWWTVLVIRLALFTITTINFRQWGCKAAILL